MDDSGGEHGENPAAAASGSSVAPDPDALVDAAHGHIAREHLVDDGGEGARTVDCLAADERVEFVMAHASKGIRIETSDGQTKTPYNGGTENRYLLITDRRLLFISQERGEPTVESYPYDRIESVETNSGLTKDRITFTVSDGDTISFWNGSGKYASTDYDEVAEFVERLQGYCPSCETGIPRESSVCPACGVEIDEPSDGPRDADAPDASDGDSPAGAAGKSPSDSSRPLERGELRDSARIEIEADHLTDDGGDGTPTIACLEPGERVLYLFAHADTGIEIEATDGSTSRPFDGCTENRYLLVTDRRLCFVGQQPGEPETASFPYHEVVDGEHNVGYTKERYTFELADGRTLHFWNGSPAYTNVDGEPAVEYAVSEGEFCPDCGAGVPRGADACQHCSAALRDRSCPDCGSLLGGDEAFCRWCGEVMTDVEEAERSEPDVATVREEARMDLYLEHLGDDGDARRESGRGPRTVDMLEAGETLLFLMAHPRKGLRFESPTGEQETPYNEAEKANRYFLVTDRRLLFLVQRPGEPPAETFGYHEIVSSEFRQGNTKGRLTLELDSGQTVSFWNRSRYAGFHEEMRTYIESRSVHCPQCGVALSGEELVCPGCQRDLDAASCQSCGTILAGAEDHCTNCGIDV